MNMKVCRNGLKMDTILYKKLIKIKVKILKTFENYKYENIKESIKITNLTFYSDPGHGWLKVPIKELKKLGIENDISSYSYMMGDYAYLEEDSDLSTYITALMKDNGYPEERRQEFLEFFRNHVKQQYTDRQSKIRNYPRYEIFSDEENDRLEKIRQQILAIGHWNQKSINRIKKASKEDLEYWAKKFDII